MSQRSTDTPEQVLTNIADSIARLGTNNQFGGHAVIVFGPMAAKCLADAGYVTSRHGAGTHVADRPPQRRGAEALDGIVAEMLRRAAVAGFTPDEVASATFAAATERKRPGPLVRVLFATSNVPTATHRKAGAIAIVSFAP